MTWEEEEKRREEHFDSLNCKCPKCNGSMKYVMYYEDYPYHYSGTCATCHKNFHYNIDGKLRNSEFNTIQGIKVIE